MKKYIKPEIKLQEFHFENIVTDSIVPIDSSGYEPSNSSDSFQSATYIMDWKN